MPGADRAVAAADRPAPVTVVLRIFRVAARHRLQVAVELRRRGVAGEAHRRLQTVVVVHRLRVEAGVERRLRLPITGVDPRPHPAGRRLEIIRLRLRPAAVIPAARACLSTGARVIPGAGRLILTPTRPIIIRIRILITRLLRLCMITARIIR